MARAVSSLAEAVVVAEEASGDCVSRSFWFVFASGVGNDSVNAANASSKLEVLFFALRPGGDSGGGVRFVLITVCPLPLGECVSEYPGNEAPFPSSRRAGEEAAEFRPLCGEDAADDAWLLAKRPLGRRPSRPADASTAASAAALMIALTFAAADDDAFASVLDGAYVAPTSDATRLRISVIGDVCCVRGWVCGDQPPVLGGDCGGVVENLADAAATAVLRGLRVASSTRTETDPRAIDDGLCVGGGCSKLFRASAAARAIPRDGEGWGSGNSARACPSSHAPPTPDRPRGDDMPSPRVAVHPLLILTFRMLQVGADMGL
jgi:hypothetical protein